MKIEGLKTPTHISLLFEAVRSRWQGRENEVEIHIVRCVFKFQESVRFQQHGLRLKTLSCSKPALWAQISEHNAGGTSEEHRHNIHAHARRDAKLQLCAGIGSLCRSVHVSQ